jgi:hypothetical protein
VLLNIRKTIQHLFVEAIVMEGRHSFLVEGSKMTQSQV